MKAPFLALFLSLIALHSSSSAQEKVHLISPNDPIAEWTFDNGREFKGATGDLSADESETHQGNPSIHLRGDFTKGGMYVQTGIKFKPTEIEELSFWVKNPGSKNFTLRLIDSTGQCHQLKILTDTSDEWQQVNFPLKKFFANRGKSDAVQGVSQYQSWSGAKDGNWHGPAKALYILLGKGDKPGIRDLWLNSVTITGPTSPPPPYQEDFISSHDSEKSLPKINGTTPLGLVISRSIDSRSKDSSITLRDFPAMPGSWKIDAGLSTDLASPDNSYQALLTLQALDADGELLESFTIADLFGKNDAGKITRTVDLPARTTRARFKAVILKASGTFTISHISATFLKESDLNTNPVSRILFQTAELGNLLFPDSPRTVEITVHAAKPLPDTKRDLAITVRDYWGVEQAPLSTLLLGPAERKGGKFIHSAILDLTEARLRIGTYYEIEASYSAPGMEPFSHQTSLAILPEARTHQFAPMEIPFTARNWDNRIQEYIRLTHRLGVRICGLWGTWDSKPPYEAKVPGLELVDELGMGWLTTTPAKFIEDGKRDYDETALRQGAKNLITQFGDHRPLIINLGNEPHGTGKIVEDNVAAYKAIYKAIKEADPTIPVVATSVEPNEEYFKNGYGKYCDAFDFHVYESPEKVRKTIQKYRALQEKYDCVKPIWSTELGLNSQGQTRLTVASEVYKKAAAFFAEGGENFSWFGLLYPDKEGKSHGSSGDSHNVFDCRFTRYAPRLDAIAYYNTVNSIADKKFVSEKSYPDGTQATLFRNAKNETLQILWNEKGWVDVSLPLAAKGEITLTRIDGTLTTLQPDENGTTISIGKDPLLLTYTSTASLPEKIGTPAATFTDLPATISASGETPIRYAPGVGNTVESLLPPLWTAAVDGLGRFIITPPLATKAREVPLSILLFRDGKITGQIHRRLPVE